MARPPNVEKDNIVLKFRLKNPPLTFREIAEILDEDVKNVYLRHRRLLAKLSTGRKKKNP